MMEGFMFRFHPQHQKVKELIDDKKIGSLVSFNGSFGFPAFPEGDIRYNKELGGGFLNDSGCYPVCASRMIFNEEPLAVFHTNILDPKTGVDVRGTSLLIYDNEKIATITYGNGNYYQAKYEVWGSDGIISLDRAYSVPPDFTTKVNLQYNIENNWDGRRNKIFEINPTDHFLEMIDAFCMEINGEKKATFNFEQELLNQSKIMTAHYNSCSSKKMVWLDEVC
jgi:NDP-hexose-3-ketoreductase